MKFDEVEKRMKCIELTLAAKLVFGFSSISFEMENSLSIISTLIFTPLSSLPINIFDTVRIGPRRTLPPRAVSDSRPPSASLHEHAPFAGGICADNRIRGTVRLRSAERLEFEYGTFQLSLTNSPVFEIVAE